MEDNTNQTPNQNSNMNPKQNPESRNTEHAPDGEITNYKSTDGAVQVVTKTTAANRYPQHNYKVVCFKFRPKFGTRVQCLKDGTGLDVLLTHPEIAALLEALKNADPKFSGIVFPSIPAKPEWRKKKWEKINAARLKNRQK